MDSEAFRKYGKEMVDLVADYWDSLKIDAEASVQGRKPLSDVQPGYIWDLVSKFFFMFILTIYNLFIFNLKIITLKI